MNIRLVLAALFVGLLTGASNVTTLVAQPFDLSWYTIDAGGGVSTGNGFEIAGTIGQHDAGTTSQGAGFSVTGGFWTIVFEESFLLGDVNGDGEVNLLDVAPFVEAIGNGTYVPEADINQDGVVNLLDVAPFVDLLSGSD